MATAVNFSMVKNHNGVVSDEAFGLDSGIIYQVTADTTITPTTNAKVFVDTTVGGVAVTISDGIRDGQTIQIVATEVSNTTEVNYNNGDDTGDLTAEDDFMKLMWIEQDSQWVPLALSLTP